MTHNSVRAAVDMDLEQNIRLDENKPKEELLLEIMQKLELDDKNGGWII